VLVGIVAGYGVWVLTHPEAAEVGPPSRKVIEAEDAAEPAREKPTEQARQDKPSANAANPDYQKLVGKWMRDDGDYVLDIQSADADGKLKAVYLNPQPIHVAKAEASQAGSTLKVFVELRDVNYPGSTYDLIYDPQSEQLIGAYYQAVQQQTFDVRFNRMP
jgi:uncharacterized protein (DUF2147 family)